jgi:hypothetical protein
MDVQAKQHEKNILAVEHLRADLSVSGGGGKPGGKDAKQSSTSQTTASKPSPTNTNQKDKDA